LAIPAHDPLTLSPGQPVFRMVVDWQQVKEIFSAALECPPEERRALLDSACRNQAELRREIETLLESHDSAGRFLVDPVRARPKPDLARTPETSDEGRSIGPYRVLRPLGQGGMGVVYLALRDDDAYRKQVAIKLIQRGLDRDAIVRRFRTERQILATLEHPSIARLIDGGQTEDGQPYLVMEYVDGEPINQWADHHRLGLRQRLELFRTVCMAVQAAHQNLVIHRDLKPSNILVTADGNPKLLDFGIAKLLDPGLTADTVIATADDEWLMTPQYASPEQLRGENITTASDVYALGLLLYELISGCRAYSLEGSAPAAMMEVVCRQVPEPASVRFAELTAEEQTENAHQRATEPRRLRRLLRGDLDRIAAKALRKEAARRYSSAEQLADDLRRHLDGLPIRARPDTALYLLNKFVHRNRALSLAMVLLLGFALAMAWQGFELRHERDESEQQRQVAEKVTEHMVDLVKNWDPLLAQGNEPTIGEALEQGALTLDSLAGQPTVHARLRKVYGEIFMNRGKYAEAEHHLQQALEIELQLGDALDIADSQNRLGALRSEQGRYEEASELMQLALAGFRQALGDRDERVARMLSNLGALHFTAGDFVTAEPLIREALALQVDLLGDQHPEVLANWANLGNLRFRRGDLAEAELLLRRALELGRQIEGENHPHTLRSLNSLAVVLRRRGANKEAAAFLRQALAGRQKVLGAEHPDVARSMNNLAIALKEAGELEEAENQFREALRLRQRTLGPDHPRVAASLNTLASFLLEVGETAQAASLFEEALRLRRKVLPAGHPKLATSLLGLGRTWLERGQAERAEPLFREAVAIRRATPETESWRTASAECLLGLSLMRLGQTEQARPLIVRSHAILIRERGPDRPESRRATLALEELSAGT